MAAKVTIVLISVLLYVIGSALFERLAPRRWVTAYQRATMPLYRPSAGLMPGWAVIETTGRKSGQPRQTPVGGRMRAHSFWLVTGERSRSQYVKNLEAEPVVRVRIHGRWRVGTAHVLDDDNPRRRLLTMSPLNSLFVGIAGTDLATIRIDLDTASMKPAAVQSSYSARPR